MTAIQSLTPQQLNPQDATGQSSASSICRESKTTLTRKQDLDVTITTTEGDRFTLSVDSSVSASSGTYSRLDVSDSQLTRREQETQSVATANQVAATAVGNFSGEEIRDVAKATRQLMKVQRDASRGHVAQVVRRLADLSKLDTLRYIDASIQVSSQLTIENRVAPETTAPADSESSSATGTVSMEA